MLHMKKLEGGAKEGKICPSVNVRLAKIDCTLLCIPNTVGEFTSGA